MFPTRRRFLASMAALPLVPSLARAAGDSDRKFLFVFNHGGWDTTRVLSPMFDAPLVSMERSAEPFTAGSLALVDHPSRPSARAFFELHHDRVALVHGVLVPSVAHEVCTRLVMTGGTRVNPDWAAVIGGSQAERFVLPNLVLEAPTFPEAYALWVARAGANGQLDGLVDGSILDGTSPAIVAPSLDAQGAVDRHVLRRTAARAAAATTPADLALSSAFDDAMRRAVTLKDQKYATSFRTGGDLGSRTQVAVDALASGITRVVTIGYPSLLFPWDSHSENDAIQGVMWEQLFAGLLRTMEQLSAASGTSGGATLLDETVVVVLSEMGRTPALNSAAGKDHWPYTSAMLFGAGVRGGVTVGGYRDNFAGLGVDRTSWALSEDADLLDTASLGATLFQLAGVDPAEFVPSGTPLLPLLD